MAPGDGTALESVLKWRITGDLSNVSFIKLNPALLMLIKDKGPNIPF
jgi:hypothetical protein